jgi:MFS family permease
LWLAQCVSLLGDWLTLIALAVVISGRSQGSGLAVSGLLLVQLVPTALVGPLSGVLADRFDRRRLLVVADVTRSVIVLLLIPAVASTRLWPVFLLATLHFSVATVFEPARTALVPRIVEAAELVAATTIATVSWSFMTAVGGAAAGGLLAVVGVRGAFVIDALSFVVSALLIASMGVPLAATARPAAEAGDPGFREGLRYLAAHERTAAVLLVKVMIGVALSDTFIVLYGTRVFPVGTGGSVSLGWLWACFGVGALLGPTLLNLTNDGSVRRMRRLILVSSAGVSLGMLLLGTAPTLAFAGLAVVLRGMGGATSWTYSTVILQKVVPDRLLGRLIAIDQATLTLTASAFALLWGWLVDVTGLRATVVTVALTSLVPLLAWTLALPWMESELTSASPASS